MYDWSDEHRAIAQAVRRFVDERIRPVLDDLEHGDLAPYGVLRDFYRTFGLDELARERVVRHLAHGVAAPTADGDTGDGAAQLLATIEICRVSPGLVTSLGVSTGLAAGTVLRLGTLAQIERWGRGLAALDTVGAWAITEPDSGSDAFGGMRTTARRDGAGYVLNGQKTWITNGPYADVIVLYAKLDEGDGTDPRERRVVTFVLDRGLEGLEQSAPLRKMGQHSSPTGDVFLHDVRVGPKRLLGESESVPGGGRSSARDNFVAERAGVAAMALGIIEECERIAVAYASDRVLWGQPIARYQLVQLKLAQMEVARLNVRNLVFTHLERSAAGVSPSLAEASAMKLYAAQAACHVADDAIQVLGGNGYIADYRVEQLSRDARVLRIYAGTDEMQVVAIARDLLRD